MKKYQHKAGVFLADDKVRIFYQCWIAPETKGAVVISHGLGEHSDRYVNLMDYLSGSGISFFAIDHRGHGKSGGKRGHTERFMKYVNDMKKFVDEIVIPETGKFPLVILGHSMGGLIAFRYVLEYQEDFTAMVLSAPALIPAVKVPQWKKLLGRMFSIIIPSLTMNNELDPADISSDPEVVQAYRDDPLVHDMVTARWYTEYLDTAEYCLARPSEIEIPLLLVHGLADRMVSPEGSRIIYENVSSKDKQYFTFEGLLHETMNERHEERKKVVKTIASWITEHIQSDKIQSASPGN
jgi:alpha-beta hydrolase superfamily lysophospholipase